MEGKLENLIVNKNRERGLDIDWFGSDDSMVSVAISDLLKFEIPEVHDTGY